MSEIEKLYENAGIEKIVIIDNECPVACSAALDFKYPLFTAEKQIELIKLLMEQEDFSWTIVQQGKDTEYAFYVGYEYSSGGFKEFTEALAGITNSLWQDLTEDKKQQIRKILR